MKIRSFFTALAFLASMLSLPQTVAAELPCSSAAKKSFYRNVSEKDLIRCLAQGEFMDIGIDGRGEEGHTMLELSLLSDASLSTIKTLLEHGADPNLLSPGPGIPQYPISKVRGASSLRKASDIISLLVEHGADLYAPDSLGYPAYESILFVDGYNDLKATPEYLDSLVELGVDMNLIYKGHDDNDYAGIIYAGLTGNDADILQKLYELSDTAMFLDEPNDNTFLHMLAGSSNGMTNFLTPEKVQWFIDHGVDPKHKNNDGQYAWELTNNPEANVAIHIMKAAAGLITGKLSDFISKDEFSEFCVANLPQSKLNRDFVTTSEVCGCVEENVERKFERIYQHESFQSKFANRSKQGQLAVLMGPLATGCLSLLSYRP